MKVYVVAWTNSCFTGEFSDPQKVFISKIAAISWIKEQGYSIEYLERFFKPEDRFYADFSLAIKEFEVEGL